MSRFQVIEAKNDAIHIKEDLLLYVQIVSDTFQSFGPPFGIFFKVEELYSANNERGHSTHHQYKYNGEQRTHLAGKGVFLAENIEHLVIFYIVLDTITDFDWELSHSSQNDEEDAIVWKPCNQVTDEAYFLNSLQIH